MQSKEEMFSMNGESWQMPTPGVDRGSQGIPSDSANGATSQNHPLVQITVSYPNEMPASSQYSIPSGNMLVSADHLLEHTVGKENADEIHSPEQEEESLRLRDATLQAKSDEELMPPPTAKLSASNTLKSEEKLEPMPERPTTLKAGSKSMSEYEEDSATSLNLETKRVYNREFLMSLQYVEPSKQKPEGLPNLADILQKSLNISNDSKGRDYSVGRNNFFQRQSSSTEIQMNQTGQQRQTEKPQALQINYQRADAKLNKIESLWKCSDSLPEESVNKEKEEHEMLLKSFGRILNRINNSNYEFLFEQVLKLPVKTEKDLQGMANLVFKDVIDYSRYSQAYAALCKKMKDFKVPSAANATEEVSFHKLLLCICQKEFEASVSGDQEVQKPHLECKLFVRNAHCRKLGNIRFIGELFRLKMVAPRVMHICIVKLLKSSEEEDLECLCTLLTMIGEELDTDQARERTSQYFTEMGRIVYGSSNKKVSWRIKFALQDVIDLRENNWKPRRENNNPKTIKQIHAEAALEAHETKMLVVKVIPSRGSMKGNPMPNPFRKASQGIEPSKLKLTKQFGVGEVQFGPSKGFGTGSSWGRGSSGSAKNTPPQQKEQPSTPNKYTALDSNVYDTHSSSSQRAPVNHGSLNRAQAVGGEAHKLSITSRGSTEKERCFSVDMVCEDSRESNLEGHSLQASAPSSSTSLSKQSGKQLTRDEWDLKIQSIIDPLLHNRKNPADDLQNLKNTRIETKSNEEIVTWIEDMMSSKKISDLDITSVITYAVVKSSIDKNGKLNEDLLQQRFPMLVRYYDSKPDRELAALSTLENLMDELQHPAELLSSICYVLAEQEIITDQSFQSWVESSNNGIAMKSISHFVVWLNLWENQ